MKSPIPYHRINAYQRSSSLWIYIFDHGGRRHILGVTRTEIFSAKPYLMISHHLVRKGLPSVPLEETSLKAKNLSSPSVTVTHFNDLVDQPLQMGRAVAAFLERHLPLIAAHLNLSTHEVMNITSEFISNLSLARRYRMRQD